jgi:hypothetical protein
MDLTEILIRILRSSGNTEANVRLLRIAMPRDSIQIELHRAQAFSSAKSQGLPSLWPIPNVNSRDIGIDGNLASGYNYENKHAMQMYVYALEYYTSARHASQAAQSSSSVVLSSSSVGSRIGR